MHVKIQVKIKFNDNLPSIISTDVICTSILRDNGPALR